MVRRIITAEEAATHNARDDLWLILNNRVYDVTSFVAAHPGGAAVLVHGSMAGVDVSAKFDAAGHSTHAVKLLESFAIGALAVGPTTVRASESPAIEASSDKPGVTWHAKRRIAILRDHPEVAALCGHDWRTIPVGFAVVAVHAATCMLVAASAGGVVSSALRTFAAAYTIGGLCKMYQFMVAHEVCHDTISTHCDDTAPRMKVLLMHLFTLPSFGFNTYEYYAHMHRGHHTQLGTTPGSESIDNHFTNLDTIPDTVFIDVGVDGDAVSVGTLQLAQYITRKGVKTKGHALVSGAKRPVWSAEEDVEEEGLLPATGLAREVERSTAAQPFWALSNEAHALVGGTHVVKRWPLLKLVTDSCFHFAHFLMMTAVSLSPMLLVPIWFLLEVTTRILQLVFIAARLAGCVGKSSLPIKTKQPQSYACVVPVGIRGVFYRTRCSRDVDAHWSEAGGPQRGAIIVASDIITVSVCEEKDSGDKVSEWIAVQVDGVEELLYVPMRSAPASEAGSIALFAKCPLSPEVTHIAALETAYYDASSCCVSVTRLDALIQLADLDTLRALRAPIQQLLLKLSSDLAHTHSSMPGLLGLKRGREAANSILGHSMAWPLAIIVLLFVAPRFAAEIARLHVPLWSLLFSTANRGGEHLVLDWFTTPTWGAVLRGVTYLALSELFLFGYLFHYNMAYFLTTHRSAPPPASREEGSATSGAARRAEEGRTQSGLDGWRDSCQPTMSTYGWFARVTSGNLCLHCEHHDFPSIPWTRLPLLRRAAPEYYDCLVSMEGWSDTLSRYFTPEGDKWVYACTG